MEPDTFIKLMDFKIETTIASFHCSIYLLKFEFFISFLHWPYSKTQFPKVNCVIPNPVSEKDHRNYKNTKGQTALLCFIGTIGNSSLSNRI